MSSNYTPVSGNIEVVDGFCNIKKYPLPTAGGGVSGLSGARSYPAGSPMWTNGAYGIEPSGLPTVAASTVTAASTFTTDALANAAFAAKFAGISIGARVPQQLSSVGLFSQPGSASAALQDASQPFQSVVDEGVALAPYYDGTNSTVTSQLEIGTLVELTSFANEATTGYYAPDGTLQKDTKTYLYQNSVQVTTSTAAAIGSICERALVGDSRVKFQFKSNLTSLAAKVL